MASRFEVDMVVKGIETSWTTWGKMRGGNLFIEPVKTVLSGADECVFRIRL